MAIPRPLAALALPLLLVLGCAQAPPAGGQAAAPVLAAQAAPVPDPALPEGPYAAAVLVAGSDEQAVFDNGRAAFAAAMRKRSPLPLAAVELSARRDGPPDVGPATRADIEAAFAKVAPKAAACLLFVTSHGSPRGLALTFARETLTPAFLDDVLRRHCTGKPTVAILSGCFSGVFADPPLPAANRIILTAAARDRTSFGCSSDLTYTYYDEALLAHLPDARTWEQLQAEAAAAVAARERAMSERPSRPQASFGATVPPDELLGR